MTLTRELTLDINPGAQLQTVKVKQCDAESNIFTVSFINSLDDSTVAVGNGQTVKFRCVKPSGYSCIYNCSVNGGAVTLTLSADSTAESGLTLADLSIEENGVILSTAAFWLDIKKSGISDHLGGANEYVELNETIERAQSVIREADQRLIPAGGVDGQVLKKKSATDYDVEWVDEDGDGAAVTVDTELSDSSTNPVQNKVIKTALDAKGTYSKPSGGIPASDLAPGVIPSVPAASSTTPLKDGNGSAGSAATYARADHVHPADTSKADKVTEVTVSTAGAVTQALDPEKIYHFTGALTALTITLNAPAAGQLAHYRFDFDSASTAPTVTIPNTVAMPGGFTVEASKHYEIDILNNYGAVMAW